MRKYRYNIKSSAGQLIAYSYVINQWQFEAIVPPDLGLQPGDTYLGWPTEQCLVLEVDGKRHSLEFFRKPVKIGEAIQNDSK